MQLLWKTAWQFLIRLNIELPYDAAILLLGMYPRELKTYVNVKACTAVVIAALFTVAGKWKLPEGSSAEEGLNKMWRTHSYIGVIFCHGEEWSICYNMDQPWKHAN